MCSRYTNLIKKKGRNSGDLYKSKHKEKKFTRIFVYKYYRMRDKIKRLINKFFETVLALVYVMSSITN